MAERERQLEIAGQRENLRRSAEPADGRITRAEAERHRAEPADERISRAAAERLTEEGKEAALPRKNRAGLWQNTRNSAHWQAGTLK